MPKSEAQKTDELEMLREKLEKLTEANRENQRAYKKRRRDKGEVLVAVWVPRARVAELQQIAKAMCLEKPKSKKESLWSAGGPSYRESTWLELHKCQT